MSVKFGFQHGTNAAYLGLKTKDYLKSIQYCPFNVMKRPFIRRKARLKTQQNMSQSYDVYSKSIFITYTLLLLIYV